VVVCHAAPSFSSFYRVSQLLPRKKLKNFCGRSAPVGCPNFISDATQSRSCAFHEIREEVQIACHPCAVWRIIFYHRPPAISTSLRGPDSVQAVITSTAANIRCEGMRAPNARKSAYSIWNCTSPRQVKSALLFRKRFVRARHPHPAAERNRAVRACSNRRRT